MSWLIKLIGGWLPIGTKPFGEYVGKIIWVVGIVVALYFAKQGIDKLFSPAQQTRQTVQSGGVANTITHNYPQPRMFGCSSVKVYEYYKEKDENILVTNSVNP